jgi:hypothetical protein
MSARIMTAIASVIEDLREYRRRGPSTSGSSTRSA